MGWGNPRTSRNKLYEADYNRAYDTHQQAPTSREFEVNRPNSSERAPHNVNTDGGYRNPLNKAYDPDDDTHTIGPRETQTGNAPSGGYSTLPGNGYAADLNGYEFPDNRRTMAYRPNDWESGQVGIHYLIDADTRERRSDAGVSEDFTRLEDAPRLEAVRAATHSPYEREWSETDRITAGTNPNRWRFWKEWGTSDGVRKDAGSRYLNGEHYSMAQHNSLNPYGPSTDGMDPVMKRRNTYRIDPQPWDEGLNDAPTNTPMYPTGGPSLASAGDSTGLGRSFRL